MKAQDYLRKGAELLEQRGKEYDKPEGERSMGKCVTAFNAITGRDLTESEGWLLLQVLKDVRQWQNPGRFHADSAEDCISYAALKAEALQGEQALRDGWTPEAIKASAFRTEEPAAAIDDDSERQQRIQQSGEMAEEVYAALDDAEKWRKWTGRKERPYGVKDGALVDVTYRCGEEDTGIREGQLRWTHSGGSFDIIAYRICKD